MPSRGKDYRGKKTREGDTFEYLRLTLNGEEYTFKLTINDDGRLFYRPTRDDLYNFPGLKSKKTRNILEMKEFIADCCSAEAPEVVRAHLFEDEMLRYVDVFKRQNKNVRASSYSNCECNVRLYILPYFKSMRLRDVRSEDCQNMLNCLLDKGMSKSIIDKAYMYLNEFLSYCTRTGIIQYNPMASVKKPKPEVIADCREKLGKKKKVKRFLNDDEIQQLLTTIHDGYEMPQKTENGREFTIHKDFVQADVYEFMLRTGLRRGEMCALKYSNWDRENQVISVEKNMATYIADKDREGHGRTVTEETNPKNEASRSRIRLSDKANELLVQMHDKEPEGYEGYIVHNRQFEPVSTDVLSGRFERIAIAAGFYEEIKGKDGEVRKKATLSLHDLRHTYASVIYEVTDSDLIAVQTKLRHASPDTTGKVYVELRDEKERELDRKIDEKF